MQAQHERFFESIDWDGWNGTDGREVSAHDKDLDSALKQLDRQADEILEEYRERQSFTPPSKERRDARQKAKHRQQKRTKDRPTRGSS